MSDIVSHLPRFNQKTSKMKYKVIIDVKTGELLGMLGSYFHLGMNPKYKNKVYTFWSIKKDSSMLTSAFALTEDKKVPLNIQKEMEINGLQLQEFKSLQDYENYLEIKGVRRGIPTIYKYKRDRFKIDPRSIYVPRPHLLIRDSNGEYWTMKYQLRQHSWPEGYTNSMVRLYFYNLNTEFNGEVETFTLRYYLTLERLFRTTTHRYHKPSIIREAWQFLDAKDLIRKMMGHEV